MNGYAKEEMRKDINNLKNRLWEYEEAIQNLYEEIKKLKCNHKNIKFEYLQCRCVKCNELLKEYTDEEGFKKDYADHLRNKAYELDGSVEDKKKSSTEEEYILGLILDALDKNRCGFAKDMENRLSSYR